MGSSTANDIDAHYSGNGDLLARIIAGLVSAGKALETLTPSDLSTVDEFHIRGRAATLELARLMRLSAGSAVLDIGSGLGGPARTVADAFGCHVTGIDLTEVFCATGLAMSQWVGLDDKVTLLKGDATEMPFADKSFDTAMTIHAAMNIAAKDRLYAEAKRVLRPGGIFAVYDILQGEGGDVVYPVPWARDRATSHLATPEDMRRLLSDAGFSIMDEIDSTGRSQAWFEETLARVTPKRPRMTAAQIILGETYGPMAENQISNLAERRIRTVAFICGA
jgi:ubiquinone/menaquinone biosynthesis C-methylase UbiE